MAFDTASELVTQLLGQGAWWYVAAGENAGWDNRRIADRLQEVFGSQEPLSFNTLYAIINRYDAARDAAQGFYRYTRNPIPESELVGYPGLESRFSYQFVMTFVNEDDPTKSKEQLFVVNSDVNLNYTDALAALQPLVDTFLSTRRTGTDRPGGLGWQPAGKPRAVAALKAI